MSSEVIMFILQGLLGALILFLGIILNGMRTSINEVTMDLKGLNNAVLGQYMTRDDSDARWKAQRELDHELRGMIQDTMVGIATVTGRKYTGVGDGTK